MANLASLWAVLQLSSLRGWCLFLLSLSRWLQFHWNSWSCCEKTSVVFWGHSAWSNTNISSWVRPLFLFKDIVLIAQQRMLCWNLYWRTTVIQIIPPSFTDAKKQGCNLQGFFRAQQKILKATEVKNIRKALLCQTSGPSYSGFGLQQWC